MWDEMVRAMMCSIDGVPYKGAFHLRQCAFNPSYYELDPQLYAKELSFIGMGTQGEVNLYAPCSQELYHAVHTFTCICSF